MCPPVPTAPDIDWQLPNNFSMVQTGMVCNTFAKQYQIRPICVIDIKNPHRINDEDFLSLINQNIL